MRDYSGWPETQIALFLTAGARVLGQWSSRELCRYRNMNSGSRYLNDIPLTSEIDSVKWALDKSKSFTSKSLYRFLFGSGVSSRVAGFVWKSKLPLKIKFFLWQIFNNKLPVTKSLTKRGWLGNKLCCLCECLEDVDHVLFKCHLAKVVWGMFQEISHLQIPPRSVKDFSSYWLLGKGPGRKD